MLSYFSKKHCNSLAGYRNEQQTSEQTPRKDLDCCKACGIGLKDDSCALSCDMCDAWLCIECIETSKSEYDLFNKMTRRLGSLWHCPVCKQKG